MTQRTPLAAGLAILVAVAAVPPSNAGQPIDLAVAAVPLELLLPADVEVNAVDPTSPTNEGIGPGSQLLIRFPTVGKLCTANWVWKDDAGTPYLGTAGHCLLPDAANAEVYACRTKCYFGGQAGGVHQTVAQRLIALGPWVKLGPVVYATAGGSSNDFGLVAIPPAAVASLDPAMPFWGAPTGVATSVADGDLAVVHGNAATLAETAATKNRAGTFHFFGAETWGATLPVAGGDSGSAVGRIVNAGAATDLSQADAAGIVTHLGACDVAGFTVQGSGVAGVWCGTGPTVARAQALAASAGLCVAVVLVGEDPTSLAPASC